MQKTIFLYLKQDGTLIGYHGSTICNVVDRTEAKQYSCITPEEIGKQHTVIRKNLDYVLNATEENQKDRFISLLGNKQRYFPDLLPDDVKLCHETINPEEL